MPAVKELLRAALELDGGAVTVPVYDAPSFWRDTEAAPAAASGFVGSPAPVREEAEAPAEPITSQAPAVITRATFAQAVAHYLEISADKPSIEQERGFLAVMLPFIGDKYLDQIYDATLKSFIDDQRKKPIMRGTKVLRVGVKSKTVNLKLATCRHVLLEACRKWRTDDGKPWLATPPHISMMPGGDERPPMPLTWEQQNEHLFKLPPHLYRMALFNLQCGVRCDVICNLKWSWMVELKDPDITVFVVPPEHVKGRIGKKSSRVLVCNSVAQKIIDECRGDHPENVFVYKHNRSGVAKPISVINNSGWQSWRAACGLGDLHVHDLRHTVGLRLREAGVPNETRAAILWHTSTNMTTHYSGDQLREIYDALEKITAPAHATNLTLASLTS